MDSNCRTWTDHETEGKLTHQREVSKNSVFEILSVIVPLLHTSCITLMWLPDSANKNAVCPVKL